MNNNNKLAIIGIDGATFDIILPMVKSGQLPNLARLMENGTFGELNSTSPPMTPPAWSTFTTGLNPGKHGIFDFTERIMGSYAVRFVNASLRSGKSMWSIASDYGKRVAVMAVPFTYPPEKVNGVMISGIDAPEVGAGGDPSIMHPTGLYKELVKNVGPYIITSSPMKDIYNGDMKAALEKVLQAVDRKAESAKYLLKMEDWDMFVMVYGETDLVGHHFWKYHDPNSPFYEEDCPEVNDSVRTVYKTIDQKIGEMLELLPEDCSVMIVSDHGFGGCGDTVVYMNKVLAELGLLKFKSFSGLNFKFTQGLHLAKKFGLRLTPHFLKKQLIKNQRGGIVNKMESMLRFSLIDWSETVAYSEETPYYPSIRINLKGREPNGTVTPGEEYERVRREIRDKILGFEDPINGNRLIKNAFFREEVYSGPSVEKAHDIVLDWNCPHGYSYMSRPSFQSRGSGPLERLTSDDLKTDRFRNKSGNHRQFGIFIASGGVFKNSEVNLKDADILDIAPTALYAQGLPVPNEMDGKVLTEAIEPYYFADNEPKINPDAQDFIDKQENPYTKAEEAIIEKRLQDLGYIE